MENRLTQLKLNEPSEIALSFTPFEIITLRLNVPEL